ncbi:MAG: hypothetical protein IJQ95_03675 [Paludibacteraceae bacterium]|nr:hypothetical protein [Paludibacteraceae bacterium]
MVNNINNFGVINFYENNNAQAKKAQVETLSNTNKTEDIEPVDTSFFGTDKFPADVCEKNLREAIDGASGKADACRRIMLADTCGYIHIRQFTDARKAELVNPFAAPKYTFYDYDFRQARNRK